MIDVPDILALEEGAARYLDTAIERWAPEHVFACFSGGNDSLSMTHFVMDHVPSAKVVHVNTGIGIRQTREFVRQTCRHQDWPLLEYEAPTEGPNSYRGLVLRFGFPGPAGHQLMYSRLKERQLERLLRDHGGKRKVLLVSGIRMQESSRRMRLKEAIQDARQQWVNPFWEWTKEQVAIYRRSRGLPLSPVAHWLHMSGECLCGAFAKPGELALIRLAFPEAAAEIEALEAEVRAAGFPWGWNDERPPEWWMHAKRSKEAGQYDAFAEEMEALGGFQPLCVRCNADVSG